MKTRLIQVTMKQDSINRQVVGIKERIAQHNRLFQSKKKTRSVMQKRNIKVNREM